MFLNILDKILSAALVVMVVGSLAFIGYQTLRLTEHQRVIQTS